MTPPHPVEIRIRRAAQQLEVDFSDGSRAVLPAELLRVESPSAEVRGHAAEQKKTVPGKRGVNVAVVEPIGRYAVRIRFSDGHDTGIYTWDYLYELGRDKETRWAAYLEALEREGLRRDP